MKFGDWVEVSAVLRRKRGYKTFNTWERQECIPFKAIFLGTRTLWDSMMAYFGHDEMGLENVNPTKGAVVCQKNRKPVYVRVEDCVLINESSAKDILRRIELLINEDK